MVWVLSIENISKHVRQVQRFVLFKTQEAKTMLLKYLKKDVGKTFRLWPIPQSTTQGPTAFELSTVKALKFGETPTPKPLPWDFNLFTMQTFDEKEKFFPLTHTLGYLLKLYPEYVIEHLPPDLLLLKVQYIITDPNVYTIPLHPWDRAKRR